MPAPQPLNWNSRSLTHGWQKGITAFYWGLGLSEDDLSKPQVGIGVPLLEGNLCNVHAASLASSIKSGCRSAGLLGFPFGVPGVSDNLTQGTEGGNASLPSRNAIANAAEMVASAHAYDALVGLHHCDKNGPGFAMALARLNFPGLIVSGGSIRPGIHNGREITILDPYDALANAAVGKIDPAEADAIIRHACPGPGGCGIAASFNTWGIAMEAIGLMLPASSSNPAEDPSKIDECLAVGHAVRTLLELDLRPRSILTVRAFENATSAIAAAGGSTNGILHLLALAREARVDFTLTHIRQILRRTPVLCDFAPRGKGTMVDLHHLGGTPALLRHLLEAGLLHGDPVTATGRTLAENVASAPLFPAAQSLVAPISSPFKAHADIQICAGNLSPAGMVFKASGDSPPAFSGEAICFHDARSVQDAVAAGNVKPGHVVVLRGLGPVAAGMPEVLVATSALSVPSLKGKVAIISDTRVSGVSHGIIGVHCAPEAALGGTIALVENGDRISFDLLEGSVHLHVTDQSLDQRRTRWHADPRNRNPVASSAARWNRTYLADFSATVTQADHGCVSRSLPDPPNP